MNKYDSAVATVFVMAVLFLLFASFSMAQYQATQLWILHQQVCYRNGGVPERVGMYDFACKLTEK